MTITKQPDFLYVGREGYMTKLVFFRDTRPLEQLAEFDVDSYGKVAQAVHDLACRTANRYYPNGLELRPMYPPGSGYFIWRVKETG